MWTTSQLGTGESLDLANRLHDESIVLDLVCPLFNQVVPRGVADYRAGGFSAIGASVTNGVGASAAETFRAVRSIYGLIQSMPDEVRLVETSDDFARAKQEGRLGVLLHFQNCTAFEGLVLVELFYRLGIRVAQLAYNVRNLVADGCTEDSDAGLSRYGTQLVRQMNRVGMVVDGTHTGIRSTLDAMEVTDSPFIFSHSGAKSVFDHVRNITDEQIRACARTGGVIGVVGLPYFLGDGDVPKLETLVRHMAYIAELVGAEHVGVGMDYHRTLTPYTTLEEQQVAHKNRGLGGLWREGDIPAPPYRCASEIETPAGMRHLTAALLRHGFSYEETKGIMGENFVRVFQAVWKPVSTA
jgi:membrane dipeptidase